EDQYEALAAAQTWYGSAEGQQAYKRRAGVEGTLSQGVRAFGLRRTRYWGLAKTHLQHVAIAAAINIDRIVAWLDERPRAQTRTSRFAALAPVAALPPADAAAWRAAAARTAPPHRDLCSMAPLTHILYYINYFCSKLT